MTPDEIYKAALAMLQAATPEERGAAYVQKNTWKWPQLLAHLKPDGWDSMTHAEKHKHPLGKEVWSAIHAATTHRQRSEAWWTIQLGRTKEEHAEWFESNFYGVAEE